MTRSRPDRSVQVRRGTNMRQDKPAAAVCARPGAHPKRPTRQPGHSGRTGRHLRDVVFLFADEAFFAGDRAHVGVVKSIITEPYPLRTLSSGFIH